MLKRVGLALITVVLVSSISSSQTPSTQQNPPAPDISGDWTGTWGSYNPAQGSAPVKELCKKLDSKVAFKDGAWEATFEGDCGRPYKYTIKMKGRQVGKVVMFQGTTDLGAKDGGVFDWIGRATEKEFVGFFTSAYYTGTFNLARPK